MSSSDNPMAYLLEFGLRKVEKEKPELASDAKYVELKSQLLREAEGHFKEIQATYATVIKTLCHCGGQLEPVDHEFGKANGTIYDSVIAKCKKCGSKQSFQFPKHGFISEARSAMALRDYLLGSYGIDYAWLAERPSSFSSLVASSPDSFLVHLAQSPSDGVANLVQAAFVSIIVHLQLLQYSCFLVHFVGENAVR